MLGRGSSHFQFSLSPTNATTVSQESQLLINALQWYSNCVKWYNARVFSYFSGFHNCFLGVEYPLFNRGWWMCFCCLCLFVCCLTCVHCVSCSELHWSCSFYFLGLWLTIVHKVVTQRAYVGAKGSHPGPFFLFFYKAYKRGGGHSRL